MKLIEVAAFAALLCVSVEHSLSAHDLVQPVQGNKQSAAAGQQQGGSAYKWNPDRYSYMPIDRQPHSSLTHGESAGVRPAPPFIVVLQNRWAIGQDLHVCFYGGTGAIRQRILS